MRRSAINGNQDGMLVIESHLPTEQEPLTSSMGQNLDEIIIAEVSARPLLWNHKINITKRDRRTVQQLWIEVADATNGTYVHTHARACCVCAGKEGKIVV